MLVFIDYEHPSGHDRPHGQALLAARTWITYRLEDLSGLHCHLVRYDRIDQALLDAIGATGLFISGNSVDPADYSPADLAAVQELMATTPLPVFGFCGGLQLIGQALGVELVRLPASAAERDDPAISIGDGGRVYEQGYHPIELAPGAADHPLMSGLGDRPVFRHAHGLHLAATPPGFRNLASTAATPIQVAVNDERRIVGTQFHPEYWTDEHPAGRALVANFLRWAQIT